MGLVVNTNVASINAQRNLLQNQSALSKSLERLSSGLRINKASDDAAGLAISEGMKAQINGLNQAIRNSGDGLSMLGTAETAMVEQTNLLQRLRELAVQSSSDTNSASNRSALNEEATQLKSELDRIAKTTDFNGVKLLDGTFTAKSLQVGYLAGADHSMSVNLESTRSTVLGQAYRTGSAGDVQGDGLAAGDVTITTADGDTFNVGASSDDGVSTAGVARSALAYANAINAVSSSTNVHASATTSHTAAAAQDNTAGDGGIDSTSDTLTINDVVIGDATISSADDDAIVVAINAKFAQTGVTASLDTNNKINLTASDGRNIEIAVAGNAAGITGLSAATGDANAHKGTVEVYSSQTFSMTDTNSDLNLTGGASPSVSLDSSENISTVDLTSRSDALDAITSIDIALESINLKRAKIGAQTNRLNSTVSNLQVVAENAEAAKSRVLDADFAAETASMTRAQILQQAGVAMLAQANQSPQIALSLLQ